MQSIVKKADPADPSYIKLCVALGQIEQWYENRFPSWIFNDGKVIGIPTYMDDAGASSIMDARVRQLPKKPSTMAGPAMEGDEKWDKEDWKLIA